MPRFVFIVIAVVIAHTPFYAHAIDLNKNMDADDVVEAFLDEQNHDINSCKQSITPDDSIGAADYEGAKGSGGASRVIIAVDSSGSMAGKLDGNTKMAEAKKAAQAFLQNIPSQVESGLIAFGHKGNNQDSGKQESCAGVEMVLAVGKNNTGNIASALTQFSPTGWTPLASAIKAAETHLTDSTQEGNRVLYVVSDGKETCGGDPVQVAKAIHDADVRAIINVIGFDLAAEDREQLKAIAEAGGGEFTEVKNAKELTERLNAMGKNLDSWLASGREHYDTTQNNYKQLNEATTKARMCVNQMITDENMAAQEVQKSLRAKEWDHANDVSSEFFDALQERWKKLREDIEAHVAELKEENQQAIDKIDDIKKQNSDAFDSKQGTMTD